METIKHAAVKSKDGWVFIGKNHANCFHKMFNIKIESSQKADAQGFVTSTGRYVLRAEGYLIALAANQIETQPDNLDCDIFDTGPSNKIKLLFSEDLWSLQNYGKYDYCEIKGYILK